MPTLERPSRRSSNRKPYNGWSPAQIKLAGMGSSAAKWNDAQRYIALRNCGCPKMEIDGELRVSARNTKNSQRSFEQYMALAEMSANALGNRMPKPSMGTGHRSWAEVCAAECDRSIALIFKIASEACARVPGKFHDASGLVAGLVRRITENDGTDGDTRCVYFTGVIEEIHACSPDQVRRVLEALRAWVGRVMHECGVRPISFDAPRSAIARAERSQIHTTTEALF